MKPMKAPKPRWFEDERLKLIEDRCERYEADWRALKAPRIEDYLFDTNGEVRNALWMEIVLLDRELREATGEPSTLADYEKSCPDGMILLDPSTANLPVSDDRVLGSEEGGLTRGVGALDSHAQSALPPGHPALIAQPLEQTEGELGETTGPIGLSATIGYIQGDVVAGEVFNDRAVGQVGSKMGDYLLLEKLGQGGMGIVFKARQNSLNRDVALKIIKTGLLADEQEVRLFRFEAESVASLDHPHIVPILDSGQHEGVLYYSMKLINGRNLAESNSRFRDTPLATAGLMSRIAEAIQHAHERGVLHRDLKPSNILLDDRGEPHVIDFGLARRIGEGAADESISDTHPMGTPSYMSPEQARGHKRNEITTATDVYGLGTILYTLLTGRPPFTGNSTKDILRRVTDEDLPPIRSRNSQVNRDLETICLKCLCKQPKDRYPSARELADDLNRFMEGRPILARPATRLERAVKWVRRRPEIAGLSAAVVILTMLGLAGIIWNWMAAVAARDDAIRNEDAARHVAYAAKLNLAERDLRDASMKEVRRQLEETVPPEGKSDLRGFEWYYLDRLCNSQEQTMVGHTNSVLAIAFSRDGRRIVSSSDDKTIKIWDAATGRLIRSITTDEVVDSFAFSLDGSQIACGGKINVTLWDTVTGQPIRTLVGHTRGVIELAYSPDGKTLASASSDGTVRIWDLATNALSHTLSDHHIGFAGEIVFSTDSKTLFSAGGNEPSIRVWDVATGRLNRSMKTSGAGPRGSLAMRPDGRILASGSDDGTITILDVATGSTIHTLKDHVHNLGPVRRLAFSPDGKTLASSILSRQAINLWDPAAGLLLGTILGHDDVITDIAYSPDGTRLASSSIDFTVKLWDPVPSQEPRSFQTKGTVSTVAYGPDGSYLASAGLDRIITLWERSSGQIARELKGHTGRVSTIAISRDGRHLASAGEDMTVRIWNLATGNMIHVLNGHTDPVCRVGFSPDGKLLASASNDRTVRLWEVESGRSIRTLEGHTGSVKTVVFSPDGKTVVSAGMDGFVMIWDVLTGRRQRVIPAHENYIYALAISPDGRWLATGGMEGAISIWDLVTTKEIHFLKGHAGPINHLLFSPDSRRLVSVSDDRTVRIWDPVFGLDIMVLRGHTGPVWDVAIAPDGKSVASASSDSAVRIWEVDKGPRRQGKP